MKKILVVIICFSFGALITLQFPSVSNLSPLPLALAEEDSLPPFPLGFKPSPSPALPPEPRPPTITHLSGQSRELELEIGTRVLNFCAAEKETIRSGDGACLMDFFSAVSERNRIEDSFGVMRSEWLFYLGSFQKGYKGKPRLDQEINDPVIIIRGNEALCYLRETIWIRALDLLSGTIRDSAQARYHSILLEKKLNSWVIKYDLFFSAYTTLPPEAPLVQGESSFPLVSGFPSFEEILSSLPAKPQWYLKMMEKAQATSSLSPSPDRGGAVKYAEMWWNGFNPNYPYYGADCANFVSQCLHEGGWLMDYEGAVWWSTKWESSLTWKLAGDHHDGQADGLCWYILANGWPDNTPRGTFLGTAADSLAVAQLEIGDVVCIERGWVYDPVNGWYYGHHVGICVGYDVDPQGNYSPLIDAHSDPAYHVHLLSFGSGYPANQIYLYKVSYPYGTTPFVLNWSGWHMITPGVYSTLPANQIFGPNLLSCYGWDAYNQYYVDKKYSSLNAGDGYWVRVSAPTNAYLSGWYYGTGFQKNILSGWNLIGSPFERITAWTNVWVYNPVYGYSLNMPAAKAAGWIKSIYQWNGNAYEAPDLGGWIWPGHGYWIKPANSVTLTFWRP